MITATDNSDVAVPGHRLPQQPKRRPVLNHDMPEHCRFISNFFLPNRLAKRPQPLKGVYAPEQMWAW